MKYFFSRTGMIALMALMAFIVGSIIGSIQAKASDKSDLLIMARNSNLEVSGEVVNAILKASRAYDIPSRELFTLAIIESNLNPNVFRVNANGTTDIGLMQINTVNIGKCLEYNINTILGNTMCSAKIIASIRTQYPRDYLGVYHSKTRRLKREYLVKVSKILYSSNQLTKGE
jgi:Transglycosylase SLT domain